MRSTAEIRPDHLISVREASARTGIPIRRLYKWIERDKLWSIRVGDRIMLHVDDVRLLQLRKAS